MIIVFCEIKKGQEYASTLVTRDRRSKVLNAHVVPNKGASVEWVIRQSLRDFENKCHSGRVLIRSDGEPALVDLINEIANLRKGITFVEHTPPGDSKANGFIERGIQTVEEMVRVYKLDLEKRIGEQLDVYPNMFAWLVVLMAKPLTKD